MTTREMPSVYKGKVNTIEDAYSLGFHDGVIYQVDSGKPYSHRNGESDPPTEYGWYWVYVGDNETPTAWLILPSSDPHLEHKYGWSRVAYYGPIPVPTRKEPSCKQQLQ